MRERPVETRPSPAEERRLWAETIDDLRYFCSLLKDHAPFIIPGEHVDDFRAAWQQLDASFGTVVAALTATKPGPQTISEEALSHGKLDGANGSLKRSMLRKGLDAFLGYFVPEPRSEQKMRLAAEAGGRYSDTGAVVMDSFSACVSQHPVVSGVCKAASEGSR